MDKTQPILTVFISYGGNEGKNLAEQLVKKMIENNIDAWTYADPYYTYGDNAWLEIYKEIETRGWMIVVATEDTFANINQQNECMHGLLRGSNVFSFSKRGVKPLEELKSRNMGIFDENNFDESCKKLIADLWKQEIEIEQRRTASSEGQNNKQNDIFSGMLLSKIRLAAKGINLERTEREEIDSGKVEKARCMIIARYLKRTIIRDMAKIGIADGDDRELQAVYMWIEDRLEQFNQNNMDYRSFCEDIADEIVTAERAYLRKFLIDKVKTGKKALSVSDTNTLKPDFSLIEYEINNLQSKGYQPSVLLSPIQITQSFMAFFRKNIKWRSGEREQLILKNNVPLTIYWSHKKLPSEEFIILDKKAILWTVIPDEKDGALATAVGVSPLYKDKVDFLAQTLFRVELLMPDGISIITVPENPAS